MLKWFSLLSTGPIMAVHKEVKQRVQNSGDRHPYDGILIALHSTANPLTLLNQLKQVSR